ncbi:unnamed protein product [Closterium sp. NIES-64]|nr:unnamed protein product [Closterium sp. NIES-64]
MSHGETVSEAAGGMETRVEQLATRLMQQEEAMAALKSEVDELKRAMVKVAEANDAEAKGANATGAEPEGAEAVCAEATDAAKGAAGGSAGEQAGAEGREEDLAPAAAGGCALIANRGASDGKEADGERKANISGLRAVVDGLRCRVVKLEKKSDKGGRVWELLLTLWARTVPKETEMDLNGISCLINAALTRLATFHT